MGAASAGTPTGSESTATPQGERRVPALRWSTTLLLLVAAAIAVTLAVRFGRSADESGAGTIRRALDGDLLPIERVHEIEIVRPGRVPLRLVRRGDGWIEAEPSGLAVDPFIVRETLETAAELEVSRIVPAAALSAESDPLGRARLGLDAPSVVTFRWGDGSTSIRLGRLGVAGRAFIEIATSGAGEADGRSRRAVGDALVVNRALHDLIVSDDPAQWRLRALFPEAGAETVAVGFEAGETRLELERRGARWEMTAPVATRADAAVVASWLGALARTEGDGWLRDLGTAEDDAILRGAGMVPPSGRFSLNSRGPAGEARRTLLVGAETALGGGDRFGMLDGHPALMQVGATTLQTLFPSPLALIEPTAVGVARADIREIRIEGPTGSFTLRRDLDRWISPQSGSAPLDGRRVTTLLQSLVEARAGSISLQPIPSELVVGRIVLLGFDDDVLAEITVAADASGAQWALDSGDGVARIFPASMAPALDPAAYGITFFAPPSEHAPSPDPSRP